MARWHERRIPAAHRRAASSVIGRGSRSRRGRETARSGRPTARRGSRAACAARRKPGIGIDLEVLQRPQGAPRRAMGVADELMPSTDAQDRRWRGANDLQQAGHLLKIELAPIGGIAADNDGRRRRLRDPSRRDLCEAEELCRCPGDFLEAVCHFRKPSPVTRARLRMVVHPLVFGIDVDNTHCYAITSLGRAVSTVSGAGTSR